MSYAPQVIADSTGQWIGNALRFETLQEAEQNAFDLMCRWTAVRDTRAVESPDPVNYSYSNRQLVSVDA